MGSLPSARSAVARRRSDRLNHPMADDQLRLRIGIDTGACYNNNLTCVVLEGANKRFLSTSAAASFADRVVAR